MDLTFKRRWLRDQGKKLTTPELNKEFIKGIYGQKQLCVSARQHITTPERNRDLIYLASRTEVSCSQVAHAC